MIIKRIKFEALVLGQFIRVMMLISLLSLPAWSQDAADDAAVGDVEKPDAGTAIEDLTPEQRAMATVKLTSPRNTLRTFLSAMNAIEADPAFWAAALQCIYIDDRRSEEEIAEAKLLSRELYKALKTITVNPDVVADIEQASEIAAEANGETNYSVDLGDDPVIPLAFNKNSDGLWRISRTILAQQIDSRELQEITEKAEENAEEALAAEEENISQGADERLSNPRKTMKTFLQAFDEGYWEKGGRDDAILTLDLSDVATNLRTEKGEEYAVRLKNILDRDHVIVFEEIAQKVDADPQVILVDPLDPSKRRVIELVPVLIAGDSGAVEWKFSKASLELLENLWNDYYVHQRPLAGFQSDVPQVLSLQIQDWMTQNAPYLMSELFLFENWKWLGLFLSILLGMIVSRIASILLLRIVRRVFSKESMRLDEKLEIGFIRPIRVGIMAWVWWIALKPLSLPQDILAPLKTAITTVSCIAFVWAIYRLVDIIGEYITKKALQTQNKYDDMIVPLIVRTLKIFVLCAGFMFIMHMNDKDYRTILAGFGLFGMAMALAAKDTLGNIFGSLTVIMDRPFQIGDWVQVGDVDGSVESVGIRSTRVRTFYNSIVTVPNAILTTAVIDNYGARRYRRYKTTIGITYDTPPEKIDAFCEGIRELIRQHPYTRKDYFHVYLNNFGASSLDIMLYCFHECPDWSTELRERHRLMTDIIRLAKGMGVEFAFPTSTLYMQQVEASDSSALNVSEGDALIEGRRAAMRIVSDQLGKNAPVPPPVTFDTPPGALEDQDDGDGDS